MVYPYDDWTVPFSTVADLTHYLCIFNQSFSRIRESTLETKMDTRLRGYDNIPGLVKIANIVLTIIGGLCVFNC